MGRAFAEITFTPAVVAAQQRHGSREAYADIEAETAPRHDRLTATERRFVMARDGFYQATVTADHWPYVQFRGGRPGFLKVLDEKTIAYADFRGNRQYLSTGNLAENDRVALILMDYAGRRRLKIWGRARLVEAASDPFLVEQLTDPDYPAVVERAVVITVEAIDWNCPQHITRRFSEAEIAAFVTPLHAQIATLEAEVERLRTAAPAPGDDLAGPARGPQSP